MSPLSTSEHKVLREQHRYLQSKRKPWRAESASSGAWRAVTSASAGANKLLIGKILAKKSPVGFNDIGLARRHQWLRPASQVAAISANTLATQTFHGTLGAAVDYLRRDFTDLGQLVVEGAKYVSTWGKLDADDEEYQSVERSYDELITRAILNNRELPSDVVNDRTFDSVRTGLSLGSNMAFVAAVGYEYNKHRSAGSHAQFHEAVYYNSDGAVRIRGTNEYRPSVYNSVSLAVDRVINNGAHEVFDINEPLGESADVIGNFEVSEIDREVRAGRDPEEHIAHAPVHSTVRGIAGQLRRASNILQPDADVREAQDLHSATFHPGALTNEDRDAIRDQSAAYYAAGQQYHV